MAGTIFANNGLEWNPKTGQWTIAITVHGRRMVVGSHKNREKAISMRRLANAAYGMPGRTGEYEEIKPRKPPKKESPTGKVRLKKPVEPAREPKSIRMTPAEIRKQEIAELRRKLGG